MTVSAFLLAVSIWTCSAVSTDAFLARPMAESRSLSSRIHVTQDIERPPTFLDEDDEDEDGGGTITFLNEHDDEENDEEKEEKPSLGRQRWENLNPKIKQRLVEKGEAKAIANKKKREPSADKKRRKYIIFQKYPCFQLRIISNI
jgi:hypothetical protein